jgi:hypothetical protein
MRERKKDRKKIRIIERTKGNMREGNEKQANKQTNQKDTATCRT